jgi:hypothetical protein
MKKVTAVLLKRSNLPWSPEISLLVVTNPEQELPLPPQVGANVAAMAEVARVAVVADSAAVAEVAAAVVVVVDRVVPVAAAGVDAAAAEVMAAVAVVAATVAAVAMTCRGKAIHKAEDINDLRRCEGTACAPLLNTVGRN